MTRRLFVNFLLLTFGLLAGIGAGELLLRSTGLGAPSPWIRHGRLPFKRRPDSHFLNRKEHVNPVQLNNWGFHDWDREVRKPGYRIIAFGDSFVEGNQVATHKLATALMERDLGARREGIEVVNAGVGGVGTAYEYLLYEEFFRGRIEMDHVILFFLNGNDLPNNHPLLERRINGNAIAGKVYVDASGSIQVREWKRSRRQRVFSFLDTQSAFFYTVHDALYRLRREWQRKRISDTPGGASLPSSGDGELDVAWEEAITGTLALIERWNHELDGRGVEFSVVIIPVADHYLKGGYGEPHKQALITRLLELGNRAHIPVLELDFSAYDPYDLYSFDGETLGHFNPRGHKIMATQVTAWLRERLAEGRRTLPRNKGAEPDASTLGIVRAGPTDAAHESVKRCRKGAGERQNDVRLNRPPFRLSCHAFFFFLSGGLQERGPRWLDLSGEFGKRSQLAHRTGPRTTGHPTVVLAIAPGTAATGIRRQSLERA